MAASIQFSGDEIHVAFCADSSTIVAAYIVPGTAVDAKDAIAQISAATGYEGDWSFIRLNGEFKPARTRGRSEK